MKVQISCQGLAIKQTTRRMGGKMIHKPKENSKTIQNLKFKKKIIITLSTTWRMGGEVETKCTKKKKTTKNSRKSQKIMRGGWSAQKTQKLIKQETQRNTKQETVSILNLETKKKSHRKPKIQ